MCLRGCLCFWQQFFSLFIILTATVADVSLDYGQKHFRLLNSIYFVLRTHRQGKIFACFKFTFLALDSKLNITVEYLHKYIAGRLVKGNCRVFIKCQ